MRDATRAVMAVQQPHIVDALKHVAGDLKTIASDELELGRNALVRHLSNVVAKASIAILGAIVALIGLAMLCTTAVVALAPVIHALWLRLLLMAMIYIAIGGAATMVCARKFARTAADLERPIEELESAFDAVAKGLTH